jgi:hypothetical protein
VALIGGGALHEVQPLGERMIVGVFVMHAEAPQQRKSGALDEFLSPIVPLGDLLPGVRRAIE